jgi:hypothetical protein
MSCFGVGVGVVDGVVDGFVDGIDVDGAMQPVKELSVNRGTKAR